MKKKRTYKNWTIIKTDSGYIAERDDYHIAPQAYRLLWHAKSAIDSGDADLTVAEWKAQEYHNQLQCGATSIEHLEYRADMLGDKAATIALKNARPTLQ